MTQQVNLLQGEFAHVAFPFFAESLVPALGAVMAVLLLLYAYSLWQTWAPEGHLAGLEADKERQTALLEELGNRNARRLPDAALAAEVGGLDRAVGGKNQLIEALASHGLANREGFSEHLLGLARQRVEAVWLKRILISSGGRSLSLAGSALTAEAVPLFIEKLAPEPAYVGREFQALLLRSPEQGPPLIHFAMSTEREQADDAPLLLDAFLQKLSRANP